MSLKFKNGKPIDPVAEQQRLNRLADKALLVQELAGLESEAALFFQSFALPSGARRHWLIPGEGVEDLDGDQIDCVLKNLAWFKAEIRKDGIK